MNIKDELTQHRYTIMRLRVRGFSTKPQNHLQHQLQVMQELATTVVRQRDDLVRTLDKAEAHIKFLENEIRTRGEV
jgi:peptidoglycan hydrolase CwlO-like protein